MNAPQRPLFSVIVPVYEQWHLVSVLLSCLEKQSLDKSLFEVIIVDNGSKAFETPVDIPPYVKILRCSKPGSYAARNEGVKSALGRWLAFTDADCMPSHKWLESLSKFAQDSNFSRALLAGQVEMISESKLPNKYEIYDLVRGIPQERYVANGYAVTANLSIRKDEFVALGGFDDTRFSGGDAEFCRRAVRRGNILTFAIAAVVRHPARKSWIEVNRKARRVKGAQLRHGPVMRRLIWSALTLMPPVRDMWLLMGNKKLPVKHRLIACLVQLKIWPLELRELIAMLTGAVAERR